MYWMNWLIWKLSEDCLDTAGILFVTDLLMETLQSDTEKSNNNPVTA